MEILEVMEWEKESEKDSEEGYNKRGIERKRKEERERKRVKETE